MIATEQEASDQPDRTSWAAWRWYGTAGGRCCVWRCPPGTIRQNLALHTRRTMAHHSRRQVLRAAAGLAAGGVGLPLLRPRPSAAQPSLRAADLVDSGMTLAQGTTQGAVVVDTPTGPLIHAAADGDRFTSAVLQSPIRFTHVGLHWRAATTAGAGCRFELRTSTDGTSWSSWRPVQPECGSHAPPVGDAFGQLHAVRDARLVQYRAAFRMPEGATLRLERVTCTVISSPAQPLSTRLRTVTVTDPDTGRSLAVTPRELWLADETYRFDAHGREVWPEMFVPAKKLVIHHTATRND